MRCLSCNVVLSDKEATRKYASTGQFLDLCDHCYSDVEEDIPVIEGNTDTEDGAYTDDTESGYGETD